MKVSIVDIAVFCQTGIGLLEVNGYIKGKKVTEGRGIGRLKVQSIQDIGQSS
ncbi:hypothetical protein ACQKL5_05675 [Peribacillus sp. NPDC097675]|uniref:hypothetical protein n=1 Tax=Peribacillus sp. NPDC097675 TaxID=3390618 RepID=UPI003D01C80D